MTAQMLDVYLAGQRIGTLHRIGRGVTELELLPEYLHKTARMHLSWSFRMAGRSVGPKAVEPWLQNLLPEKESVLAEWSRRFSVEEPTAFGYLEHVGGDLTGAVQVIAHEADLPTSGEVHSVTDQEIGDELRRLRGLRSTGGFLRTVDGRVHLSPVAGQQSKLTLVRSQDGTWGRPIGNQASTHIVKLGFDSVPSSDVVEYITMQAAQKLDLPVARTSLEWFDGELGVVVERFDRHVDSEGQVSRRHQEDLCQALGLSHEVKYEHEGGPSVVQTAGVLREAGAPGSRIANRSVEVFAQALAFNLFVGGTDAHGKNYSIVHYQGGSHLAPLYDLNTVFALFPEADVLHRHKLAMRYGRTYEIRGMKAENLARTADDLGISRDRFVDVITSMSGRIVGAFAEVWDGLSPELRERVPEQDFLQALSRHVGLIGEAASQTPAVSDLPKQSRPSRSEPKHSGEVWLGGHWQDGRWVPGKYRTRSRRAR